MDTRIVLNVVKNLADSDQKKKKIAEAETSTKFTAGYPRVKEKLLKAGTSVAMDRKWREISRVRGDFRNFNAYGYRQEFSHLKTNVISQPTMTIVY